MFGLSFEKLAIIAIIAVFLVGPERLPLYAGRLATLVKHLRSLADTAKARVEDELGPEFVGTEWKKLDPRQYDPRRIIREALSDVDPTGVAEPSATVGVPPAVGGATEPVPLPKTAPAAVQEHSMQRLIGLSRNARAAQLSTARSSPAPVSKSALTGSESKRSSTSVASTGQPAPSTDAYNHVTTASSSDAAISAAGSPHYEDTIGPRAPNFAMNPITPDHHDAVPQR